MRRVRQGVVLLDAIVALAVDSARASERAAVADAATQRASALFDAVALWPREDLDRHLGTRDQGPWRMTVGRPTPTLYTVALTDSSERHVLLATVLFRAQLPHAP